MKVLSLSIIIGPMLLVGSLFLIAGCEESSNDDKVKSIDKDGSVEAVLSVEHLRNGKQVFKDTKNFWVQGRIYKTTVSSDTIPELGETVEDGETSAGDDTILVVPKNYQIFVTVK